MSNKTLLLSAVSLLIGFTCAYLIFSPDSKYLTDSNQQTELPSQVIVQNEHTDSTSKTTGNPGYISGNTFNARFENIENSISLIQQQLQDIEFNLSEFQNSSRNSSSNSLSNLSNTTQTSTSLLNRRQANQQQARYRQRTYTVEQLVKGGINFAVADDIVRRKNAVEIKRLELSDRATRENYMNTQNYFDELAVIDQSDVNLREELGDDQYDNYLFKSRQSNRVKILSVMLGSAAEQAGLEKGDIILSYNNNRLFTWAELKQATAEGELGEYTSINISRSGEVFSYSVPRGTLGIQMGATRLSP